MNAQEKWKQEYKRAKYARENYSLFESCDILATASMYRREAALERKLEAAQREIERAALACKIARRYLENDVKEYGLICHHDDGECVCALRAVIDKLDDAIRARADEQRERKGE
jgi:hypothetical protein